MYAHPAKLKTPVNSGVWHGGLEPSNTE